MFSSYEPRPRRLRHADRQLPAAAGPVRRPELLHAGPERAVRDPRRQQRRRQGGPHLPVPLQEHAATATTADRSAAQNVAIPLMQAGPGHRAERRRLNVNETFTRRRRARRPPHRHARRVTNAHGRQHHLRQAGRQHRHEDDPDYAAYAGAAHLHRQHPGLQRRRARSSSASARTRSPSTSARSSTCVNVPGAADFTPGRSRVPARQLAEGRRRRRPGRQERHLAGARGADELPDRRRRNDPVIGGWTTASLRQGRLLSTDAEEPATRPRRSPAAPGPRSRASACRWSTRSSSACRTRTVQRHQAEGRRPVRDLRDQPDAAGAARDRARRRRASRRPTSRAPTWWRPS